MDAVTYPTPSVAAFLTQSLVPIRVLHDSQPLASRFNVQWTPTLVTLDAEGAEHHRSVGFRAPEELIPSLRLGIAKCAFDAGRVDQAAELLDRLVSEFPHSDAAPEAVYLRGVSRFKATHDPQALKQAYEALKAEHPGTEWEKRAYPYRLL
ncbi:MAG: tetratricopeptide repeat protein [Deltaproteobacteria bacterium]|nr:tetratricopeptide repeat protein [Deltaproteobacteria bacterium]